MVAKPEPTPLDVADAWVDPVAGVPARQPRPAHRPGAAVNNPDVPAVAIRHATIMTANGQTIADGTIVLAHGAIASLGADGKVAIPNGARIVDGTGKFVTPGMIDAHSHIGVYAAPNSHSTYDGN